jgi:SanA protein
MKRTRKYLKVITWLIVFVLLACVITVLVCNQIIENNAEEKVFSDINYISQNEYGLLLGTTPQTRIGRRKNYFFKYRIEATEQLYKAGKIKRILISGDENSLDGVNEVECMKDSLIAHGVDVNDIILDGKGFRTLDAVVRAVKVYDIHSFIVISQRFHNERAIYLAEHLGLDVHDIQGFNAANPTSKMALMTYIREYFARVKVFVDLFTQKEPLTLEKNGQTTEYDYPTLPRDTINCFLGHPLIINDSICEQISEIAKNDKMLSYNDSILQIADVRWRINLGLPSIVLFTSTEPDAPEMKAVVKYITGIYGNPYDDEEDGYNIKWSSSKDPNDIFMPGCTLVKLRRVHSEEGGTFLIINF